MEINIYIHMESILRKRVSRLEIKTADSPCRGSLEWYRQRHEMLTASEVPTALGENRYENEQTLMNRKVKFMEASIDNEDWVTQRQPIALDIYRMMNPQEEIIELNLVTHPSIKWLGSGSINLTRSGKLVSIVAPKHRRIRGSSAENEDEAALKYFFQVAQIKLEITNVNLCDFVQVGFSVYDNKHEWENQKCKSKTVAGQTIIPAKHDLFIKQTQKTLYWIVDTYKCDTIERESYWFRCVALPRLKHFHRQWIQYKKAGLGKLAKDVSVPVMTAASEDEWDEWVSATKTHNYMRSDCLLDWLDYYVGHPKNMPNIQVQKIQTKSTNIRGDIPSYHGFLMERGVEFEDLVLQNLYKRFRDHIVSVASGAEARSIPRANETIEAMKKGVPIIYQGVLHDHQRKTYGMPDLIVRSDWLNKLVVHPCITTEMAEQPAPDLGNNPWHYRVIDIKLSSLRFNADLRTLRNQKNLACYKAQVCIYNDAVAQIQGYTPSAAYILGRQWTCDRVGLMPNKSKDPFDRLGVVDFTNFDYPILAQTTDAIEWIRRMRTEGKTWSICPPSVPELYPNMNNDHDGPWYAIKKRLANQNSEITMLWHCGVKHREKALQYGICSWTDPECTVETLGMTGPKRVPILEAILNVNKRKDTLVLPCHIKNNMHRWKFTQDYCDFYVDIEAVNDVIMGPGTVSEDINSLIFMIGVGYVSSHNNKWEFKAFVVNEISMDEELRIIFEFEDFILKLCRSKNKLRLFHWGHYDRNIFQKKLRQYGLDNSKLGPECWVDFLRVVKAEPVVIRGALNFGLKEMAKAMHKHGLIKNYYEQHSVCSNGLSAMIAAWNCHLEAKKLKVSMQMLPLMKSVKSYNEMDCKLVWEIVHYLRTYHVDSKQANTIADIAGINEPQSHNECRKRKRNDSSSKVIIHKKFKIC